jgi:hypothetical protein
MDELDHKLLNSTFLDSLATMKGERLMKSVFIAVGHKNPFKRHLNQLLDRWIPSGITQHLCNLAYSDIFQQFDVEVEESLRVLSLGDMEFGFVIWLGTVPIPIIAFVCEILSMLIKKMVRNVAGAIGMLTLLRTRMSFY